MPPLEPSSLRTAVTCDVPGTLCARDMAHLVCHVSNGGSATLRSTEPKPVHVSYRWFSPDGELVADGWREVLRRPLHRRGETDVTLRVLAPWTTGTYELRISPVQELVAWFDDIDPANGLRATIEVVDAA